MPLQFKPAVFVAVAPVILAAIALLLLRLRFFGSISSLCARFSYLLVVSEDPEDTESGEEPITQDDAWYVWQKVVVLALPEYPYLIGALLTALFTTACDFLQPLFIGMALDTVANPSTAHLSLSTIFTILVVVQLIRGLAEYGRERLNNNIGDFVRHRAQDLYVSKVLSFEVGFFDRTHTSDLNKLYHNLNDIHGLAGHQVPRIIRSALTVLCAGSYMIYVDPLLGSIVLFFILLQALAEKIAEKFVIETWRALQRIEKSVHKLREECFSNIRTVKQFSCESKQAARFSGILSQDREVRKMLVHTWAVRCSCGELLMGSVILLTWYIGLRQIQHGESSIGEVSSFALLVRILRDAAMGIFETYRDAIKAVLPLRKTFHAIDRVSRIPVSEGVVVDRSVMQGRIQLHNVSFAYPSRAETLVLQDMCITLEPGTVTALCGPSGGGKSTVASMVLRDYDPLQGSVTIDGSDLRTLNLQALHKQMAVVSQEPVLFSASIADNIKFGIEHEVTHAQVEAAARLANAHDFIVGFEQGYETDVGEKGVRLSGGQKQRIAIARAVLMDPKILVLDEATSALDAENEHLVQSALDRLMLNRTTLIIAHRLSTIKGADNIIVVSQGQVAEQGRSEDLLARGGVYAALVEKQLTAAGA